MLMAGVLVNGILMMSVRVVMRVFVAVLMLVRVLVWVGHSCPTGSRQIALSVDDYVHFSCCNAAAVHARNVQLRANIKSYDGPYKNFRRNSGIDQSAKKHVAADSGKAV